MANEYVLPNIRCLNMNVGPNVGIPAYQRKQVIKDVSAEGPTIAFVQEFTWKKGLQRGAFKNFEIPEHLCFVGNVDSGFIYDNRYLDCEQLNLDSNVRDIYVDSTFDLPRLCICKFTSKVLPDFKLLCVSWHGHHKITVENKENHLRSLFWFLLKVKVYQGNLPLMIAGDFNLYSDKVRDLCMNEFPYLVVVPGPSSIMMWVLSSDFSNTVNYSVKDARTYQALDHEVLTMELQIATPVNAPPILPIQGVVPQSISHQPMSSPIGLQQTLSQGIGLHQTLNSQFNRSVMSSIKMTTTRVCYQDPNIELSRTQVICT